MNRLESYYREQAKACVDATRRLGNPSGPSRCHGGAAMSSTTDDAFIQATDSLIALYRSIERKTFDLPLISFTPFFIYVWAWAKFAFFLLVGLAALEAPS
jgi:hypothetical protein